ncbi:MAG: valine--tRNA ligase [Actinomycetota bacterium]
MSQELSTTYQPAEIERRWYETWEEQGLFHARPNPDKKPYTIVIPPPNVTGALHVGHALGHTLQDAFARRARMMGFETLWLPGSDHAGIATQNVVERELAKEGFDRHKLGRDEFVRRVWRWKETYGGRILEQMRRLGDSVDWERERFTMDEGLSRAVRTVFVRWFDDGLIYRGLRIINWCPRCTTALSDIEVKHSDVAGELVTFRYPLEDGSGYVAVATTRIETMLGDSGIAVHPGDERYADLVGKRVKHPFFPQRVVPIVADDAVDADFGTGAVKVTPAHDATDFEIGERHGLEKINILDERAHLNVNAGRFEGSDRYDARRAVLNELQQLGLVDGVERPYVHSVGHCDRCGTEIEPWLSEQWFVKMQPLVGPAIEVVRDGRVRIEPPRFRKAYEDWMLGIRDWCISRQLWWGHRIPVWYCDDCGEVRASMEDVTTCAACGSGKVHQDPDVLDTWFSSQLWPFSTLGWPDDSEDLRYFYPTTLLATGYEILYLWVARMITSGLYFMEDVPFREVLIHGIVRDFEGSKMSKSKGNVVDPLTMIDRYGADALRFSLAFAAVPGNDTNVSEDRIEGARNFANKLWNAARFVLLVVGDERPEIPGPDALDVKDRWILSRLDETIVEIEGHLAAFNWSEAARSLHRFAWSEYCDWYIELAKLDASTKREKTTYAVLLHVLDAVLRLLHPIMPFITEELWSRLDPSGGSIMSGSWPVAAGRSDRDAQATMERFRELVTALRRLKVDHGIPPGRPMSVAVDAGEHADEVRTLSAAVTALARLESIELTDALPPPSGHARALTSAGLEMSVALGDVIDLEVERDRLRKKIDSATADVDRARRKLDNGDFIARAPAAVVDKERAKLEEALSARETLEDQLRALEA